MEDSPRGALGFDASDIPGGCLALDPGPLSDSVKSGVPVEPLVLGVGKESCMAGAHIFESPFVGCSLRDRGGLEDYLLSSPGLLSDRVDSTPPWTPSPRADGISLNGGSPRSVLDFFPVSITPSVQDGEDGPEAVDDVSRDDAQVLDQFREACRRPITPVLNRPTTRRGRAKRICSGPVRRSSGFVDVSPQAPQSDSSSVA